MAGIKYECVLRRGRETEPNQEQDDEYRRHATYARNVKYWPEMSCSRRLSIVVGHACVIKPSSLAKLNFSQWGWPQLLEMVIGSRLQTRVGCRRKEGVDNVK